MKRDRNAPAFRSYKRPDSQVKAYVPGITVRCGNASRGCRGIVGYATSGLLIEREAVLPQAAAPNPSTWHLTHPDKYRGDAVSGYVVMDATNGRRSKGGERIGARRSSQLNTFRDAEAGRPIPGGPRRIVGQFPAPPCLVFCPTCGAPNWVEPPEGPPIQLFGKR